jgi:N-acetylmuramoyl-L-alanine amidase
MNRIDFKSILLTGIGLFLIVHGNICQSASMKQEHTVLIVSGHVKEPASDIDNRGAASYSGRFEYEFNDAVVRYFEDKFHQISGIRYDVILASGNMGLRERVEYANRIMPAFYIEIHHDAAQPEDIERAKRDGEGSPLWKDMSGFSVHYSENNPFPEKSKAFAQIVADEMMGNGFKPNHYHADVEKMSCCNRLRGIYNRISPWRLYVLSNVKSPAVVIECGTIVNPHEEKLLSQETNRLKIVKAINRALVKFFEK